MLSLFCIMCPAENLALGVKIAGTYPGDSLKVSAGQWFVAGQGTAKDISDSLGITEGTSGTAIVMFVAGYYGRAGTNIWEWIASKIGSPKGV